MKDFFRNKRAGNSRFYRVFSRPVMRFLMVLVLAVSCGDKAAVEQDDAESERSVPVQVLVLKPQSVELSLSATGIIKPFQEVNVSTEITGTVESIEAEVGDGVKKSDALIILDRELKELALRQSEAQFIKARATYEKAVKDRKRMEELVKTNDIAENDYDAAVLQEEISRGDMEMLDASLQTARKQLRDTKISTPIPGIVAQRYVELGTAVMPGDRIAKVIDLSRVKISVGIAETDISNIRLRQKVTVQVVGVPGEMFTGSIYTIGPEADESTRTFPVEILVPNDDRLSLRSGMAAQVQIVTESHENVLMIPQDAILGEGTERWVYRIESGIARNTPITPGKTKGNEILIVHGLSPGETIAIVGHRQLTEGVRVKIIEVP